MFKLVKYFVFIVLFISLKVSASSLATAHLEPFTPKIYPFSAKYNVLRKGDVVGSASRKLTIKDDNTLSYSYKTEAELFFYSDIREEFSTLKLQNKQLTPLHYIFKRSGTGPDKHVEWKFVPDENEAICIEEGEDNHHINMDFQNPIQDKLSYHLQQQLNLIDNPEQKVFNFRVIQNSGKIKNYVYEFDGEEELLLPYGSLKTIRLKREVVEKKKVTYVWFAPELNYLLVRLHQIKGDVEQFEAQLDQYTLIN